MGCLDKEAGPNILREMVVKGGFVYVHSIQRPVSVWTIRSRIYTWLISLFTGRFWTALTPLSTLQP